MPNYPLDHPQLPAARLIYPGGYPTRIVNLKLTRVLSPFAIRPVRAESRSSPVRWPSGALSLHFST